MRPPTVKGSGACPIPWPAASPTDELRDPVRFGDEVYLLCRATTAQGTRGGWQPVGAVPAVGGSAEALVGCGTHAPTAGGPQNMGRVPQPLRLRVESGWDLRGVPLRSGNALLLRECGGGELLCVNPAAKDSERFLSTGQRGPSDCAEMTVRKLSGMLNL